MPRRPETPEESRTPPDINHLYSIKVDNLSFRTTLAVVESHFKDFGKLGDIYVPRDRHTHESRGFAFVRYFNERDAEDALDSMDGKVIDGRRIRCAMARYGRPSGERPKRGFRSFYQEGRASAYRGRGGGRFRGGYSGRDRSRSLSRDRYRRSRSRSRSPRYRKRSPSRSPVNGGGYSPRRSRSRSPNNYRSRSPYRRGYSRSP